MIHPLEQVAQQVSRTDQELIYHLILEQQETNRLLRELIPKEPIKETVIESTPTIEDTKALPDKHIQPQTRRKRK